MLFYLFIAASSFSIGFALAMWLVKPTFPCEHCKYEPKQDSSRPE